MPRSKIELFLDKAKDSKKTARVECLVEGSDPMTVMEMPDSERFDLFVRLDHVLYAATQGRFGFISELNDLQSDDDGNTVFANKRDIPLRIVNLVLRPYGFRVVVK